MIGNILGWLVIVGVALLLGWATWRAWRAKKPLVKWGGTILGGLLTLVFALVGVVVLIGLIKGYSRVSTPAPDVAVAATWESFARGEHIADTFCASCHSLTSELPLTGGTDIGKDFPINLGKFVAVNLTPAGPLKDFTDGEIFRAVRDGIDEEGHTLSVMSTARGRNLSDEDVKAVIVYLRDQPPVANETLEPPDQPNLLAMVMLGAGLLPEGQPPVGAAITAPPKGPTAEYGEYLFSYNDCRECHGENLKGGVKGQLAPMGWNLELVKGWTQEQFINTLRTGVDPNGYTLSPSMPWKNIGRMDDVELAAMYAYLMAME
jgi:mono/diheme cytochrome c family protein